MATTTMCSGHKVVGYCINAIFDVTSPFKHRDLTFVEFFLVPEALLLCRVVVVARLNNCCVPSSAFHILQIDYKILLWVSLETI